MRNYYNFNYTNRTYDFYQGEATFSTFTACPFVCIYKSIRDISDHLLRCVRIFLLTSNFHDFSLQQ